MSKGADEDENVEEVDKETNSLYANLAETEGEGGEEEGEEGVNYEQEEDDNLTLAERMKIGKKKLVA